MHLIQLSYELKGFDSKLKMNKLNMMKG
jgi:hypothetical protein